MTEITGQPGSFNSMRNDDMRTLRQCYNLCTRHEVVQPLIVGQHEHLVLGRDLSDAHENRHRCKNSSRCGGLFKWK